MQLQHQKVLNAARQMGIDVKDLSTVMNRDAAVLDYKGQSELLVRGTPSSVISVRSQYYCDNKALTKEAFKHLNIPAPQGIIFENPDSEEVRNFFKPGNIYVCKPPDGTNGVGVEMNIASLGDIKAYWQKYHNEAQRFFLLEEQISGEDLRVQVVGGKVVAVCTREPAHVIGDGKHSIKELAESLRKIVVAQNPANDLIIDEQTNRLLSEQKLTLTDIPEEGQTVLLKELANMAQGAIAIDKTDEFHPDFQKWIDKIVDYFGTPYFAIDIIAEDLTKSPDQKAWALEINARPEWMHHTFSRVKTHDMGRIVLESLFGR
jgi:cyanophycin synthetase